MVVINVGRYGDHTVCGQGLRGASAAIPRDVRAGLTLLVTVIGALVLAYELVTATLAAIALRQSAGTQKAL